MISQVPQLRASWIAFFALTWAVSGLSPVGAQTDGVPNEQTLEESLRKKPVTPKPAPDPATTKKVAEPAGAASAPPKPAHRGALIPMVVVSDSACALEVNGDPIAALEPNAVKKLSVYPGDQLVKCASTEEPGEIYSAVQNIKAGEQTVLQIGLAAQIAAVRQKREVQAQEDAVRQRMETAKRLPVRPDLPFPVGDDIWTALENSPYYLNLPHRTRKLTVSVSSTVHGDPSNGSSLSWSQATTRDIVPLGDKCVILHSVTRKSAAGDAPPEVTDEYQCGELKLETVVGGKVIRAASLSDVETFLQEDKASREKPSCEVPSSGPASAFHPALTGIATRYGCGSGEYYFEDLSVWLYELGEMDPEKQQYVLPGPGYHFASVADGNSDGKITTTYDAFSWADNI